MRQQDQPQVLDLLMKKIPQTFAIIRYIPNKSMTDKEQPQCDLFFVLCLRSHVLKPNS